MTKGVYREGDVTAGKLIWIEIHKGTNIHSQHICIVLEMTQRHQSVRDISIQFVSTNTGVLIQG